MKFGLLLSLLLFGQIAFAQTLGAQKIKEEMLARVETLIQKVKESRDLLKDDHPSLDQVRLACSNIKDLFALYPDHVMAIGTHMNLFENRTIETKNDALNQLIFFHRQNLICQQGHDFENVDPRLLGRELKEIEKSLGKQKKNIKKSDTDSDNKFSYQYEF